jgi:hypothetical protein
MYSTNNVLPPPSEDKERSLPCLVIDRDGIWHLAEFFFPQMIWVSDSQSAIDVTHWDLLELPYNHPIRDK